jgi:hypothetical protein
MCDSFLIWVSMPRLVCILSHVAPDALLVKVMQRAEAAVARVLAELAGRTADGRHHVDER